MCTCEIRNQQHKDLKSVFLITIACRFSVALFKFIHAETLSVVTHGKKKDVLVLDCKWQPEQVQPFS